MAAKLLLFFASGVGSIDCDAMAQQLLSPPRSTLSFVRRRKERKREREREREIERETKRERVRERLRERERERERDRERAR